MVEKIINKLRKKGKIDKQFKLWLNFQFGFYSQGLLIENGWDSTVVYQYDIERDTLRGTFGDKELQHVDTWVIEQSDDEAYHLIFYDKDVMWFSFEMNWTTNKAPQYFNFEQICK